MTQQRRLGAALALLLAVIIGWGAGICAAQQAACTSAIQESDCPGSTGSSAEFHFSLSACRVVSTYQERCNFGFQFGYVDGVMGAVKEPNGYLYFGSAKSNSTTCRGTPNTQGVYRLVPDANDPTHINSAVCSALLFPLNKQGNLTPRGVTGPYDSDYLGGGPAMEITDGPNKFILLTYHAEFQYGQPRSNLANLFFGTLGLAVSMDEGKTFRKLGQIIQPHSSRKLWIRHFPTKSLSVGNGPFILGDEKYNPVSPQDADPEKTYLYVFYIDQAPGVCGGNQCLAVARARLSDVIKAVYDTNTAAVPYLFRKYYNGNFDEPAATTDVNNNIPSGLYSEVLPGAFSPSIIYDPTSRRAILAYQVPNEHTIAFRTSSNLVEWNPSQLPLATLDERPKYWVRYPSLIQTGGEQGNAPQLWIFYTHDPNDSKGAWTKATFMARSIKVTE